MNSVDNIGDACGARTKQTKEIDTNNKESKRKSLNEYGHMLSLYVTN